MRFSLNLIFTAYATGQVGGKSCDPDGEVLNNQQVQNF